MTTRSRRTVGGASLAILRPLVVALTLVTVGPSAAAGSEQQVFAAGNQFVPPAVAAATGDGLRFVNTDVASHNVTSVPAGLFGTSGNVAPGAAGEVKGASRLKSGQYRFVCTLHPGMTGILYVGAAGAPGVPGISPGSPTTGTDPATLLPRVAPAPLRGGDWPFYGHDLANSRHGTDGPSWNEVATMRPVWSLHSTNGDFTGTPVVSSGTLVAGSFGGSVFAANASTGKLRWSHNFKLPINGTPAIAGGRVFVPLARPNGPLLAALSLRSGRVLWRRVIDVQKDADVYGSPVVWRGSVYIGLSALYGETSDPKVHVRGAVVAFDARRGRRRWRHYTVPRGRDGGSVWTTPAIDTRTGTLYVGTGNAYHAPAAGTTDSVLALSSRTGRLLAHFQASAGDVWNETSNVNAGPDADFGASVQLLRSAQGRNLLGAGQKSATYWALDRRTLRPVWNRTIGPSLQFLGGIIGSPAY
ncbi:MAG: PQQ-binding-like beta-propeller repeat protein, partial [Actinomycetota bacterium]|nr:PQQ-binding-like beta-propeller repeat protein [Actinomycetota bacterium]